MKKISIILILIIMPIIAIGQSIIRANPFYTAPQTSIYCTEYQAILSAMTTDPSNDIKEYQNTMVEALIAGGYWARMDQLLISATEVNTGGEALINWINPGTYDADSVLWDTPPTIGAFEYVSQDPPVEPTFRTIILQHSEKIIMHNGKIITID